MPVEKSDFTATEIKAGLLVLASLAVLVVFIGAVRGCRPGPENVARFTASFTNIAGLNEGADVRFGGVQVGRVTTIEPDAEDRTKIEVTMQVRQDIPVNRASVATIEQVSLTAEKHLEISTGSAEAELLPDGGTIQSRIAGGGLIDMSQLEGVTTRLETLLDGLIVMVGGGDFGGSGRDAVEAVDLPELMMTLQSTLEDGAAAAREMSSLIGDNRAGFNNVIEQLGELESSANELVTQLTGMISENREPLNASVVNLQRLTEDMSRQIDELAGSLAVSLRHMEATGGSLNEFLDQQRPALEEIVRNLRDTTADLSRLAEVLADRPDALIRGARPRGRETEER